MNRTIGTALVLLAGCGCAGELPQEYALASARIERNGVLLEAACGGPVIDQGFWRFTIDGDEFDAEILTDFDARVAGRIADDGTSKTFAVLECDRACPQQAYSMTADGDDLVQRLQGRAVVSENMDTCASCSGPSMIVRDGCVQSSNETIVFRYVRVR